VQRNLHAFFPFSFPFSIQKRHFLTLPQQFALFSPADNGKDEKVGIP